MIWRNPKVPTYIKMWEDSALYIFLYNSDLEESSLLIPAGMGKSAAVVEPNYSFGKF